MLATESFIEATSDFFSELQVLSLSARWHEDIDGLEVMKIGIEKPTTDGVEALQLKRHYIKNQSFIHNLSYWDLHKYRHPGVSGFHNKP